MRFFGLIVAVSLCVLARPALAGDVPAQSFFDRAEFASPRLSPDGGSLVFLKPLNDAARQLVHLDLATGEQKSITPADKNAVHFRWVDNQRVVVTTQNLDGTAQEKDLFNVVTVATNKSRNFARRAVEREPSMARMAKTYSKWCTMEFFHRLPEFPNTILATTRSPKDGQDILQGQVLSVRATPITDVVQVDIKRGRTKIVARNNGEIHRWIADFQGRVRIGIARDSSLTTKIYYRDSDEEFQVLKSYGMGEARFMPLAFNSDGVTLYVLSDHQGPTLALYEFDTSTGEFGQEIFAHENVDVEDVRLSPDGGEVVAAIYSADKTYVHYFDGPQAQKEKRIAATLPGYGTRIDSVSSDGSALVFAANEQDPGSYFLFDGEKEEIQALSLSETSIKDVSLAKTESFSLEARDGETLHGYVTFPKKRNGAMLMLVHGGPHGVRDYWGYDGDVQFLANRGYVVIQANFRGSSGYGREFERKGWGEWGQAIQDDIADVTQWALSKDFGEADKVCVVGSSFGGYSAIMSAVRYPKLYQCAVSFAGVMDLNLLLAQSKKKDTTGLHAFLQKVLNTQQRDSAQLRAASPVGQVDNIQVPVLIAHGEQDSRVPVEHTQSLESALKSEGRYHKALYYEDEGHHLSNADNRAHFNVTMDEFIREHLDLNAGPAVASK